LTIFPFVVCILGSASVLVCLSVTIDRECVKPVLPHAAPVVCKHLML